MSKAGVDFKYSLVNEFIHSADLRVSGWFSEAAGQASVRTLRLVALVVELKHREAVDSVVGFKLCKLWFGRECDSSSMLD